MAVARALRVNPAVVSEKTWKTGMAAEREHRDVTRGDPMKTGRIVLAHLREYPDYYARLVRMEAAARRHWARRRRPAVVLRKRP